MMYKYFVIVFCLISSIVNISSAQTLRSEVSQSLVESGQVITVKYRFNHTESGRFVPPEFSPFKVVSGPSQSSSIRIINGIKDSEYSWTYQLLAPDKPGKYSIPKATVLLSKGNKTESPPLQIEVILSPTSPHSSSSKTRVINNKPYWIEIESPNKEVYTGQMILIRCKLYSTVELSSIELIQVPSYEECTFFNRQQFDHTTKEELVQGKRVLTKVIQEIAIAPQKPGNIEIGPFIMRVAKMNKEDQSIWFPFSSDQSFETISSNVISLQVKAIPTPIPDEFIGGVGQYESNITFNPSIPQSGKTLQARLSIRGTGDIKRIQAPDIKWPESFDLYDVVTVKEEYKELTSSVIGEKVFDYVIVPREPGKYEIEAPITYFSTDNKNFKTQILKASLEIKKGLDNGEDPEILSKIWDETTQQDENLSFNNRISNYQKGIGVLSIIGALSFLFLYYLPKKRQQIKSTKPFKQNAIQELKTLANKNNQEEFLLHLQRIIYQWVALVNGTDLARLDRRQVVEFIENQTIAEVHKKSLKELLEMSDTSLYMPTHTNLDFLKIISQSLETLSEVLPSDLTV